MSSKKQFEALKVVGILPDEGRTQWFSGAEESVKFLGTNATSEFVVLYASMPCAWIVSAFALTERLYPVDRESLREASISLDDTWVIQKSYGGGEGHRVYLDPPLSFSAKALEGGDLPVFRRTFYGMDRVEPFEINQKLLHCLGLFFVEHRKAYCRLDSNGDLEDVINIHHEEGTDAFDRREMVTIRIEDLAEYLALSKMTLIRRFDFTRVDHRTFTGWGDPQRETKGQDELYYNLGLGGGNGSWANGYQLLRTSITVADLEARFAAENSSKAQREYETFIAYDWKNRRVVETSCSPEATGNYFTENELPFELSPAFFRPEVLARYKADPEKYRLDDRSISCRNAWTLKTFDINEAGQVHTYLVYLADLPIAEQRYWKAFNEAPKAGISQRAFETDFQGEWSSQYDPLFEVKQAVELLNKSGVAWWSPRAAALSDTTRYPNTDSEKEWSDEILALDQLVVEGFIERALKALIEHAGGVQPTHSGGLNALAAALRARGLREDEAAKTVQPFKALHHLRSKVKGHSSPREKAELISAALQAHRSFPAHFLALASEIDVALANVLAALDVPGRKSST